MNTTSIIRRMKQALKVETDSDLARALSIRPSTVSAWKQRNSVPYAEAIRTAKMTGISTDYFFGLVSETDQPINGEIEASAYDVVLTMSDLLQGTEHPATDVADVFVDLFRYSYDTRVAGKERMNLTEAAKYRLHHLSAAR